MSEQLTKSQVKRLAKQSPSKLADEVDALRRELVYKDKEIDRLVSVLKDTIERLTRLECKMQKWPYF